MVTSIANVNSTLDKISSATAAAKRAGIAISTGFHGDIFCCVALGNNINRAINLTDSNANLKLAALLQHIYAVTPAPSTVGVTH